MTALFLSSSSSSRRRRRHADIMATAAAVTASTLQTINSSLQPLSRVLGILFLLSQNQNAGETMVIKFELEWTLIDDQRRHGKWNIHDSSSRDLGDRSMIMSPPQKGTMIPRGGWLLAACSTTTDITTSYWLPSSVIW